MKDIVFQYEKDDYNQIFLFENYLITFSKSLSYLCQCFSNCVPLSTTFTWWTARNPKNSESFLPKILDLNLYKINSKLSSSFFKKFLTVFQALTHIKQVQQNPISHLSHKLKCILYYPINPISIPVDYSRYSTIRGKKSHLNHHKARKPWLSL